MLKLNEVVAEYIANEVNQSVGEPVMTSFEVQCLADGADQLIKFTHFVELCRLYTEVFDITPRITVIGGLAYCTLCGDQVLGDKCICTM